MKLTENKLSDAIKAGKTDNLYFIYGKEPFLIKMYVERIIKKTVGDDANDFNLQTLEGCPDPDMLADLIDTLPVFSEKKVVAVKDIDPEEMTGGLDKQYLSLLENVSDTTILLLYSINVEIDDKKVKTKKFIDTVDKHGTVCKIDLMKPPKIAELCVKKAAKGGIVISQEDALYLTERTGGKMNTASDETSKLMSFVGKGGTITREHINMLVPKPLEAEVFDLAGAINSGKRAEAYRIVDELFRKRISAVSIMAALSSTYLDLYCAKLAQLGRVDPAAAAKELGRTWSFQKSYPAASKLSIGFLRETVRLLSETDIALKSVPINNEVLVEQAVTKLFMSREKMHR